MGDSNRVKRGQNSQSPTLLVILGGSRNFVRETCARCQLVLPIREAWYHFVIKNHLGQKMLRPGFKDHFLNLCKPGNH